jgi:hypothetical protein
VPGDFSVGLRTLPGLVGFCAGPGLVFPFDLRTLPGLVSFGAGPGLVFPFGLRTLPGLVFPLEPMEAQLLSNCLFNQSRPLFIASSATWRVTFLTLSANLLNAPEHGF